MNINPEDKIESVPAVTIRNFFRKVGDASFCIQFFIDYASITHETAIKVINRLLENGYLKTDKCNYYCITTEGRRFLGASAAKPIHRRSANKFLKEFMNRVSEVNNSERFLYEVSKVVIFGSYLKDRGRISDIDIAIELSPKEKDVVKMAELKEKHIVEAIKSGKRFNNFISSLFWPREEVVLFLKARKRSISLHEYAFEKKLIETGVHKVLYDKEG